MTIGKKFMCTMITQRICRNESEILFFFLFLLFSSCYLQLTGVDYGFYNYCCKITEIQYSRFLTFIQFLLHTCISSKKVCNYTNAFFMPHYIQGVRSKDAFIIVFAYSSSSFYVRLFFFFIHFLVLCPTQ